MSGEEAVVCGARRRTAMNSCQVRVVQTLHGSCYRSDHAARTCSRSSLRKLKASSIISDASAGEAGGRTSSGKDRVIQE